MADAFIHNEHGVWCPSCGELIANASNVDDDGIEPGECRVCGFPDDAEAMGAYHAGDDLDDCQ
ncbi:MAG TPA: hypothetical protein VJQ77_05910 [Novosphingobium sp.]|nr:hypothetical protein [Novosphingobium sp.]